MVPESFTRDKKMSLTIRKPRDYDCVESFIQAKEKTQQKCLALKTNWDWPKIKPNVPIIWGSVHYSSKMWCCCKFSLLAVHTFQSLITQICQTVEMFCKIWQCSL